MAQLEGLEHDYAYKLLMRVAKARKLTYVPTRVAKPGDAPIIGLTAATQQLRARLGDYLYRLEGSHSEIARLVGITAKAQSVARDRPFNYNWTLSQIERLGEANGYEFAEFLQLLLAPALKAKVA